MCARERDDLLLHPFKRRKHHFLNGIAKRETMGDAVHVFRGEREVHPFENILEARSLELELDEILDGFYVVIGGRNSLISLALDLLDDVRIFDRDISKGTEELELLLGERALHGDIPSAREKAQIRALDDEAIFDQCVFTEIPSERRGGRTIAAVDGGNCGQWFKQHGISFFSMRG